MLSEDKIREKYESATKLFAKTGYERFMYEAMAYQKVLEISDVDAIQLIEKYEEMYAKEV